MCDGFDVKCPDFTKSHDYRLTCWRSVCNLLHRSAKSNYDSDLARERRDQRAFEQGIGWAEFGARRSLTKVAGWDLLGQEASGER